MLIQAIYIYDIIPMTLFTEVCCYCESQMTDNDLFWTLLDLLALENISFSGNIAITVQVEEMTKLDYNVT